ncbi:MAG: hypothetical protein QM765_29545 [Myxococcales bacterium]
MRLVPSRHRRMLGLVLAAVPLLAMGCKRDSKPRVPPASARPAEKLDLSALPMAEAVTRAECLSYLKRGVVEDRGPAPTSFDLCLAIEGRSLRRHFPEPIPVGRFPKLQSCLESFAQRAVLDVRPVSDCWTSPESFSPLAQPGEHCLSDAHCASGGCKVSDDGCMALCDPASPRRLIVHRVDGEPCETSDDCAEGLFCPTSQPRTCQPAHRLREPCSSLDKLHRECDPTTSCIEGSCQPRRSEGQRCSLGVDCVQGLRCFEGRCLPRRVLGESCAGLFDCYVWLRCAEGTCRNDTAKVGDSCRGAGLNPCGVGLYCELGTKRCSLVKGPDERCSSHDECASGFCRETTPEREQRTCAAPCTTRTP